MPHQKQLKESIATMLAAIIALLAFGTVLFSFVEGWSLTDSFYFVTMTATTVGYGDLVPTHTLSKIITIFYSLMIIPIILYAFMAIAKFEVERVYNQLHRVEKKQEEEEEELEKTERKLREQKRLLKEHEEDIEKTEKTLKKQEKINVEQEQELKGHQAKLKKQEKELEEVEEVLEHEREEIKEDLRGRKTHK
jgi:large-conductance mechanosensitive channel